MSQGPYRDASREVVIDWATESEALAGLDTIRELLAERGVDLEPRRLVLLRPTALALVESEPEPAVFVAWQLARLLNELLDGAGSADRLYRAGETSPVWVLTDNADRALRVSRGETLLERPPPIEQDWAALGVGLAGLLLLGTITGAFVTLGAWLALGVWVGALVLSVVIGRLLKNAPATRQRWARGALELLVVVVPMGELVRRGAHGWLALVLAVAVSAFAYQRWVLRRRARLTVATDDPRAASQ